MVPGAPLALSVASPSDRRLRLVEWLLLAYLVLTTAIGLLRLPQRPDVGWVLIANLLTLLLVALAVRAGPTGFGALLRELYPVLLLGAFYPAIDVLNGFGGASAHDSTVRGWEHHLFGVDLSLAWWQAMPSRFWSSVFHAAYLAYYPIILGPVIAFLVRGRTDAARRSVLWLLAAFLPCYAVFLLFPVAGPYYEFPRPPAWFLSNIPARLVYATLERGSAYGAAFPSSHVAATLVATAAAFRGSRALGLALLAPAALLTAGVVYCQMHYGVDVLAGLAEGALVVAAGRWYEIHWGPGAA